MPKLLKGRILRLEFNVVVGHARISNQMLFPPRWPVLVNKQHDDATPLGPLDPISAVINGFSSAELAQSLITDLQSGEKECAAKGDFIVEPKTLRTKKIILEMHQLAFSKKDHELFRLDAALSIIGRDFDHSHTITTNYPILDVPQPDMFSPHSLIRGKQAQRRWLGTAFIATANTHPMSPHSWPNKTPQTIQQECGNLKRSFYDTAYDQMDTILNIYGEKHSVIGSLMSVVKNGKYTHLKDNFFVLHAFNDDTEPKDWVVEGAPTPASTALAAQPNYIRTIIANRLGIKLKPQAQ